MNFDIFFLLKIFGSLSCWVQRFHERRFSAECFALFSLASLTYIYQEKRSLRFQKAFQYSKLCTIKK